MSNNPPISQVALSDDSNATFLIRWRGRQEGPYTAAVIRSETRCKSNWLLHEISHNGQWVTLREFFAEREAVIRSENQVREEESRKAREEAERQTREREERRQTGTSLGRTEEKTTFCRPAWQNASVASPPGHSQPVILKPHRAGTILHLGNHRLDYLWTALYRRMVDGDSDIREMDAGIMDKAGDPRQAPVALWAFLGSILWILAIVFFIVFQI